MALAGVARDADHQLDRTVLAADRPPQIGVIGGVPSGTAVEDLVLDGHAVLKDPVDMAVEQAGEIWPVFQVCKGLAQDLVRRTPKQRQHCGVGVSEASLPIKGVYEIRNRRQLRLEEAGLRCLAVVRDGRWWFFRHHPGSPSGLPTRRQQADPLGSSVGIVRIVRRQTA